MRSFLAGIRNLSLPFGAAPGVPHIELTNDLPPDLIAYYAAFSEVALSGMVLFRGSNVAYEYLILVYDAGGGVFMCQGGKSSTGTIGETFRAFAIGGSNFMQVGTRNNFAALEIVNGANIHVQNTSQLIVADSASQTFRDTTNLVFIGTSVAQWLSGTKIRMENGSLIQIDAGGTVTIDGTTQGRGVVAQASAATSSAAIGAEAVALTALNLVGGGTTDFLDGHAYRHAVTGQCLGSVANIATFRIRRTNAAGALVLGGAQFDLPAASNREKEWIAIVTNTTGATVTYSPAFTLQASAGTVTHSAGATLSRSYIVEDIGNAADFPNYPGV